MMTKIRSGIIDLPDLSKAPEVEGGKPAPLDSATSNGIAPLDAIDAHGVGRLFRIHRQDDAVAVPDANSRQRLRLRRTLIISSLHWKLLG